MKNMHKKNYLLKAAVSIVVALAFIMPVTAFVNTIEQSNPMPQSMEPTTHYGNMTVESKTVTAGDNNVPIEITGDFNIGDLNLTAWQITLEYDPNVFEIADVDFTGGIGQPADMATLYLVNETYPGNMTIGSIWLPPPLGPGGPGTQMSEVLLCTLLVDILPSAQDGITEIKILKNWEVFPVWLTKYAPMGGGFLPDRHNGTLTVTGGVEYYDLTVNIVGSGTVDLDPPGGTYAEGTSVVLTAVPDPDWVFDSWSGDITGDTNPITITAMDSDKEVTATFLELFDLTINTVGSGTVTADPTPGPYEDGTIVELTATEDSGWEFIGWSGDLTGDTNPDDILMDADKTVTATFEELPKIPDLDGEGDLSWVDVEPSSTVTGTITIENVGDPLSLLDWEVESAPSWGTFSFDPEDGTDLTPEDGELTIEVEIVAPTDEDTEFNGTIVIVNTENSGDSIEIDVSLATPLVQNTAQSLLVQLLEKLCQRFPILEMFISSLVILLR